MDKVHAKRLLKLADHMEKVKPERFDMGTWYTKDVCGPTCCILGHAASIPAFKKLGLKLDLFEYYGAIDGLISFKEWSSTAAGMQFFGLTSDESRHLFHSHVIRTPKQAAEAIRKLVKKYHKELCHG